MSVILARHRRTDDGAILVIVLIVVTVVAMVLAAVLTQTSGSLQHTTVVRGHLAKVYAADAGVEDAIQSIKRDNTICPDPDHDKTLVRTYNDRTVEVECHTISGSANGLLGYAVIVRDPVDSLTTQGGVAVAKQIAGPIYAVRLPSSINVDVTLGDVTEQEGRCSTDADIPADLTIAPGYGYHCVPTGSVPDPDHDLPSSVPANALAPDTTTVPGCKIFKPGTYTSALALASKNYFASGVYYFKNVGAVTVSSQQVVAGAQATTESLVNKDGDDSVQPCATDADAGITDPDVGTGVKFIFGGDSAIVADNPSGKIELFARADGDAETDDSEGTQGISVQTVQASDPAPWQASTLGAGDAVIRVADGNNVAFTSHGMVYVPNALVDFSATNESEAQLRGGVVAARLKLQSSASASGLAVSVNARPGQRHIVVTSRAKGVSDGERDVIATAVFDISSVFNSDGTRDVSIESWNTT